MTLAFTKLSQHAPLNVYVRKFDRVFLMNKGMLMNIYDTAFNIPNLVTYCFIM